jgi:hypothetical protein
MYFQFKLLSIVFVNLFSIPFAMGADVPTYNEVLAEQIKCNSKYFSSAIWDQKDPVFSKMQPSTFVVISKPIVSDLPQNNNQKLGERSFKVSAILYSKFRCETKERIRPSLEKEGVLETLVTISETKAGNGLFHITGGEPGLFKESNPDIYSNFLYEGNGGKEWDGFFCVVLIDDFFKKTDAINVETLCKGKPKKDREATKKTIEQTRKAWLAAGVGKLK